MRKPEGGSPEDRRLFSKCGANSLDFGIITTLLIYCFREQASMLHTVNRSAGQCPSQNQTSTSGRQNPVQTHASSRRNALIGLAALPFLAQPRECSAEEANIPLKNHISKSLNFLRCLWLFPPLRRLQKIGKEGHQANQH